MNNSMKSLLFIIAFLGSNQLSIQANNGLFPLIIESTFCENTIILPASTIVALRLNEDLSSEDLEVGNTVHLEIYNDVIIQGVVVITAGSHAEARVSRVNKSCDDCSNCMNNGCSLLEIRAEFATAIDGTTVYLKGNPTKVKGQCCGKGAAVLKMGRQISATVRRNTTIYL